MRYFFVIPKQAVGKSKWRRSIVAMLTIQHIAWKVANNYTDVFKSDYVVVNAATGKVAPL